MGKEFYYSFMRSRYYEYTGPMEMKIKFPCQIILIRNRFVLKPQIPSGYGA